MRSRTLSIVLLAAAWSGTGAQEPWLQPGGRVRVSSPAANLHNADVTVVWLHGDTVVVRSGGFRVNSHGHRLTDTTVTSIPLAAITELAVHRGTKSNTGTGAAIGLGAGLAAGLVLAAATSASEECPPSATFCWETTSEDYAAGIAVFALAGAGLGALIGSFTKTDKWEAVPFDGVRLSVSTTSGRFGLRARIVH